MQELRISLSTQEDFEAKPNPTQVKRMLNDCVQKFNKSMNLAEYPSDQTPWFDIWKHTFLGNLENYDHEFIGAYVGVMFFIAEGDLVDFKSVLTKLQLQVKTVANLKWFFPNFFKYCVVLSERGDQVVETNSESFEPTQTIHPSFNDLKAFYDANRCSWFTIDPQKNNVEVPSLDSPDHTTHYDLPETQDPLSFLSSDQDIELEDRKIQQYFGAMRSETRTIKNDKMSKKCEELVRKAIIQTILPWSERQLAILWESLASRKGLRRSLVSATKQLLAMSTSTLNQKGSNQSIIYSLEANEMQYRKFADLAMSLGLYDVAFNSYYAARKEFQSEGAWIYYAAASEAAAFASILINKPQKHYLDHAISTYLDIARIPNLATRATLIATDAIIDSSPTDAANHFIRLPSDDNDLRSALFLEQAAKCFQIASPSRKRKAAFHYVLAGHRYNRCGFKRLALACYVRFSFSPWTSALEHINYTAAKLYLQIANSTAEEQLRLLYREKGLHLLRINAEKQLFFTEFIKELKKTQNSNFSAIVPHLNVPIIRNISRSTIEGLPLNKNLKQNCFLNEPVVLSLTLFSSFEIILDDLRLCCDNSNIECVSNSITLESSQEQTIKSSLISNTICDFNVTGLSYSIEGLKFQHNFHEKWRKMLMFNCLKTLPPLDVFIKIGHYAENMNSIELITGQSIEMILKLTFCDPTNNSSDYRAHLYTNIPFLDSTISSSQPIKVSFGKDNVFILQAPSSPRTHSFFFKIVYTKIDEPYKDRTYTRNIDVFVRECVQIDGLLEKVASLRNLSSNSSISISSGGKDNLVIGPGLTGHLLTHNHVIDWTINNAKGQISLC